ncbi:MAG TPA: hypothetical protein VM308_00840 [Sphingomicrobium sp.]|nr:hypothetical protein [Sphingomicrobium sp.]
MKKLLLTAGAGALLALGAPAVAKPDHGKGHAVKVHKVKQAKVKSPKKVWVNACPRGLVWRGTACVPPGHAKRVLAVGARVPTGWAYTPWGAVPVDLRTHYALDPNYRYVYRDNVIYVVDPRTRLIQSIISAIL